MSNELYLHSRWILSGYSERYWHLISEHPSATDTIRRIVDEYLVPSASIVDLSCLGSEDLFLLASLGNTLVTHSQNQVVDERLADFSEVMGNVADWVNPSFAEATVELVTETDPNAVIERLGLCEPSGLGQTIRLGDLRELDRIGRGAADEVDPFPARTWLLLGPGPRVYVGDRGSRVALVEKTGINPSRTEAVREDFGAFEDRLIRVFEGLTGASQLSLEGCIDQVERESGNRLVAMWAQIAELALKTIQQSTFLLCTAPQPES